MHSLLFGLSLSFMMLSGCTVVLQIVLQDMVKLDTQIKINCINIIVLAVNAVFQTIRTIVDLVMVEESVVGVVWLVLSVIILIVHVVLAKQLTDEKIKQTTPKKREN